jgi:hypothetical protein
MKRANALPPEHSFTKSKSKTFCRLGLPGRESAKSRNRLTIRQYGMGFSGFRRPADFSGLTMNSIEVAKSLQIDDLVNRVAYGCTAAVVPIDDLVNLVAYGCTAAVVPKAAWTHSASMLRN